jgi:hypothetical protein
MREEDMQKSKKMEDMSIDQASDFWDSHDFTEFPDIQEVKGVRFKLKKKKYVGIDNRLYEKIKKQAQKLRINEDSLINDWLKEKVGA